VTTNLPVAGSSERVPALDGIRGVAILLVLLLHGMVFGGFAPRSALDRVLNAAANTGWVGVDLFFVLSGFLITGILYDTRRDRHYFRTFYIRRALRIVPVYYGFLLLYFVAAPFLLPASQVPRLSWGGLAWAASYLSNYPTGFEGWGVLPHPVRHVWSLAIEEQFYFCWPLLIYKLSRRRLMTLCLLGVALAWAIRAVLVAGSLPIAGYVLTPARLGPLAMGGFAALAARDPGDLRVLTHWARRALLVVSALGVGFLLWRRSFSYMDPLVQLVGFDALALLFASVIVVCVTAAPGSILQRVSSHAALRFFGRYSYAIYLFHQPMILALGGIGLSTAIVPAVWGSNWPGGLLFVLIATAASLGASLVSWHLWEKHFLRLKQRFAYGGAVRRAGVAAF
jgi:peptidoglycan/LPS O-acetylase OafA/YrhL